jgi:amidase
LTEELHFLSATEALAAFRARRLSPVELLDAVIARAEATEETVNALCHRFFEGAREQARAAEARYAPGGEPPRPLEGIPLAVKEEEPIAGQPWTQGSLIYEELVAGHTSTFAQRMLDAGAIVHARTTAPEFSCAGFTHSRLWGVTRNPWNPEYAVGGSSGGAGAALAAGSTTLASGSDIGGSIRIPASFNGVVGFKPPHGRVPQDPPFNLDTYCHVGPMARTVADTALYQNVIAGPDSLDIASLLPEVVLPDRFEGIEGMRIAVSTDLGDWPVDAEIRANTLDVAAALRQCGAIVDEVDVHVPQAEAVRAADIHYVHGFAGWIAATVAEHPDQVTDYALELARVCREVAAGAPMFEGLEIEARLWPPVGLVLAEYEALICPSVVTRGLIAGDSYVDHGIEVDGRDLRHYFHAMMTVVFNLFSRCPVLAMPSGFASNGVPTGVQIATRPYQDVAAFRIGAALDEARPRRERPGLGQEAGG